MHRLSDFSPWRFSHASREQENDGAALSADSAAYAVQGRGMPKVPQHAPWPKRGTLHNTGQQ